MERDKLFRIFCEMSPSKFLYQHTMILESLMLKIAKKYGEDDEKWGKLAIAHGIDLDKLSSFTEYHGDLAASIMSDHFAPHYIIYALLVHNSPAHNLRKRKLDQFLYSADILVYAFLKYIEKNKIDITSTFNAVNFEDFLNNPNCTSIKVLEIINSINNTDISLSDQIHMDEYISLLFKSVEEVNEVLINY